nr:MAG TPA: hypothetical protein [Caudoviricetes sp.]
MPWRFPCLPPPPYLHPSVDAAILLIFFIFIFLFC